MENIIEEQKPFSEHLKEIRNRLLIVFISFLVIFFISYFSSPYLIALIKSSATDYDIKLNIFKVTESVTIIMKIMFLQSICAIVPILIFQIYAFIKPALNKKLRKLVVIITPFVSSLFFIGTYIGLKFIVPVLILFLLKSSEIIGVTTVYSFTDYFNFVFTVSLIFGIILELPAFVSFLTFSKIITPVILTNFRKLFYPLLALIAVVVTPPDFISDLIVMALLFFLFEVSVFLSKIIYKKQMVEQIEKNVEREVN